MAHPYLLDFARLVLHLSPKVSGQFRFRSWNICLLSSRAHTCVLGAAGQCYRLPNKFLLFLVTHFCHILRKHDGISV